MQIKGVVFKGKNIGKKLGFPTANIKLKVLVDSGVYSGTAWVNNKKYKAAIFVGADQQVLEVHIIGYKTNLYGKEITVKIGKKLRDVRKFKNNKEAQEWIKKDVDLISKS
jgi:riboflavin kinase/FMN adenylyltransferase